MTKNMLIKVYKAIRGRISPDKPTNETQNSYSLVSHLPPVVLSSHKEIEQAFYLYRMHGLRNKRGVK
jgi:hypothetical protein